MWRLWVTQHSRVVHVPTFPLVTLPQHSDLTKLSKTSTINDQTGQKLLYRSSKNVLLDGDRRWWLLHDHIDMHVGRSTDAYKMLFSIQRQ